MGEDIFQHIRDRVGRLLSFAERRRSRAPRFIQRLAEFQTNPAVQTVAGVVGPPTGRLQAAFRHPRTGKVIPTGAAHNLDAVSDPVTRRIMSDAIAENPELAGFVDEAGNYFTRSQAAKATGAARGESSFIRSQQGGARGRALLPTAAAAGAGTAAVADPEGFAQALGGVVNLFTAPFRGETGEADQRRNTAGRTNTAEGALEIEMRRRRQVRENLGRP